MGLWQSPMLVKVQYLGLLPVAMTMALLIIIWYSTTLKSFAGLSAPSLMRWHGQAAQHVSCGSGGATSEEERKPVRTETWPVSR